MKFVGPVDVRSLNNRQGRVTLSSPLPIEIVPEIFKELELSEFRLIKRCTGTILKKYTHRGTPATRAEGGTQGTPLYIYRVGVLVIYS